jgi:hypothetical protein
MVGRTELLTPSREKAAESAIRNLSSSDSSVRVKAFEFLRAQGRYVEPIVRRTLQGARDDSVRSLCRRLLQSDFVTELRSALKDAATGGKTYHHPLYARARLAQLLRDVGLGEEAAEEGRLALAGLKRMAQPAMEDHESRHYLRAAARASEGIGDNTQALNWYAKFVRFGSQSPKCGGCHTLEGPRDMSFYRDWWAGERFARYAGAAGQAGALISRHEQALRENSANMEARLALAYLYGAKGDRASADRMWASLVGTAQRAGGN